MPLDNCKSGTPEKKSDQNEELQIAVLTAELSRIAAEERKFEVKEVLISKKRKLELELENHR